MDQLDARRSVAEARSEASPEWTRIAKFRRYMTGHQKRPWLPDNVEGEYLDIAQKAATNWMHLVVQATSEGLVVAGYGDDTGDSSVWKDVWQANGMDARQHALHRAALVSGYAYYIVMPGNDDPDDPNAIGGVFMRPEAADNLFAYYDDPNDEWPQWAARRVRRTRGQERWELYDDASRYDFEWSTAGAGNGRYLGQVNHELGVCPVVQVRASHNLMGHPVGEVEPVTPIQDRIVDAVFTMQMVAKYGAFPQRWIAGMTAPAPEEDQDESELSPQIKAYVDHILMAADPETKFGQFEAADLNQYAQALETHVRHLAAISQTPPHYLLAGLVNVSAEGITAAESGHARKVEERRQVIGEGHEQALRLAAQAAGNSDSADDRTSQVQWKDTTTRSLGAIADAIQKLAAVGVPKELYLGLLPGVSKTDVDKAVTKMEAEEEKAKAEEAKKLADAAKAAGPPAGPAPANAPAPE